MATAKKKVSIDVRRATPLDVSNIVRLLLEGNKETAAAFGSPDEGRLTALVLDLIRTSFVVVADISGRLVGVLAFSGYQPAYSLEWVMDAEWFYLKPQIRESGVGQAMLKRAIAFADKHGVALRLGLCETDAPEFLETWLAQLGLKPAHRSYTRAAKNNEQRQEPDANADPQPVVRAGRAERAEQGEHPVDPAV